MRNEFSYRGSHVRKSGRRRLLAATAFVIVVFLADLALGGVLRDQLRAGGASLSVWGARAGDVIWGSGIFASRRSLQNQNELLSSRLADLEERAAASETLRAENDALRVLVNVVGTSTGEAGGGITVPVVSSTRSSPYGTFLIGAGTLDGITQNSVVLTGGGFVVGTVTDTAPHTSIVTEVFAPAASIDASVNGAPVSVVGSGGGNARTKVPRDLAVAVGDSIFAPVFEQRAIGVVGAVASSSASASQDVYIRLPVNLAALQYVYIIPAR